MRFLWPNLVSWQPHTLPPSTTLAAPARMRLIRKIYGSQSNRASKNWLPRLPSPQREIVWSSSCNASSQNYTNTTKKDSGAPWGWVAIVVKSEIKFCLARHYLMPFPKFWWFWKNYYIKHVLFFNIISTKTEERKEMRNSIEKITSGNYFRNAVEEWWIC